MSDLKKIGEGLYEIPRSGKMRVPGLIVATEKLIQEEQLEKSLEQVKNVAQLPGIVGRSIAMPDIHWGYGFPIGGVAGTDASSGVISPGGVGYDINCGVRVALVKRSFDSIKDKAQELLQAIFDKVPSGVGKGRRESKGLTESDYKNIATKGSKWSLEQGYGIETDLFHTESHGCLEGGTIDFISKEAMLRGQHQLGSIGSGNHFVEVGEIDSVFDSKIGKDWGVEKGNIYIFIHSGSRGFGHQVCQDALDLFLQRGFAKDLPDKQLVCAPLQSEEGKQYLQSMNAAANFAFNNRQQILHFVREAFTQVFGWNKEEIPLLYDVCHNIAKIESHLVQGKQKNLCVHRKGATRAFGPNHPELASIYQASGQPVLVPGDMGRASFLMAGLGNPLTWGSCCHGAGRAMSRMQSSKSWKGKDLKKEMKQKGVLVAASSNRTVSEEMPEAYKDVNEVVKAAEMAKLAKIIAKLRPKLVLKG